MKSLRRKERIEFRNQAVLGFTNSNSHFADRYFLVEVVHFPQRVSRHCQNFYVRLTLAHWPGCCS